MNEAPRNHEGPSPPSPLPPRPGTENLFRLFLDAVEDGIFVSNPATGRFMEVNQPGLATQSLSSSAAISTRHDRQLPVPERATSTNRGRMI
jgi:hypothetical protein